MKKIKIYENYTWRLSPPQGVIIISSQTLVFTQRTHSSVVVVVALNAAGDGMASFYGIINTIDKIQSNWKNTFIFHRQFIIKKKKKKNLLIFKSFCTKLIIKEILVSLFFYSSNNFFIYCKYPKFPSSFS